MTIGSCHTSSQTRKYLSKLNLSRKFNTIHSKNVHRAVGILMWLVLYFGDITPKPNYSRLTRNKAFALIYWYSNSEIAFNVVTQNNGHAYYIRKYQIVLTSLYIFLLYTCYILFELGKFCFILFELGKLANFSNYFINIITHSFSFGKKSNEWRKSEKINEIEKNEKSNEFFQRKFQWIWRTAECRQSTQIYHEMKILWNAYLHCQKDFSPCLSLKWHCTCYRERSHGKLRYFSTYYSSDMLMVCLYIS